jgi:DUF4097 and DUF4098 domain-containing protein YvlB
MRAVLSLLLLLASAQPARADVSDKITRTVAIAPGTAISLRVTVGDVVVRGWDRDDVGVEIARRAPDRTQLARVSADIQQSGGELVVRALQADEGRDARLRADVVLRIPAAAQLREVAVFEGGVDLEDLRGASSVRVERGDIVARRLSGTIRLETSIGSIRLDDAALSADGLMRLRTFNGDVSLHLARLPTDARILALSMGGTITSDIPLNVKDRWGPRFGEATLGKGEPVISIDVVNGNVSLRVAAAAR